MNARWTTRVLVPGFGVLVFLAAVHCEKGSCGAGSDCAPEPAAVCKTAADCTGLAPASQCLGDWQCVENQCKYQCDTPECATDKDCGIDRECVKGSCQPVLKPCIQSGCSGEVCAADAKDTDCSLKPWFACLKLTTCGAFGTAGTCGFDPNTKYVACVEGVTCSGNADCPAGFGCALPDCGAGTDCIGAKGNCDPGFVPGCKTDADCPKNESCQGGFCSLKEGLCFTDADCPEGQHCDNLVNCGPDTNCPGPYACVADAPQCVADKDCGEGMHCLQPGDKCCSGAACDSIWPMCGTCAPIEGACSLDSDCGAGEFCDHSALADKPGCCVPTDPSGAGCPPDYPACPGVCRLKDGLCWTDADCAKGEHCNNLVNCGPSTNCPGPYSCVTDAQCKTDKDCPAIPMPLGCDGSGKCVSGQCVYECQPVCVKDADCGEGMRCLQPGDDCCSGAYCDPSWPMCGTCAPAEVECKADSDCKAGEFCDHSAWADKVGCCVPTDPSGAGCPSDFPVCPGVCRLKDGLCWTDADCAAGTHCQDDVNCGPDMNCMGPYTCVPDPVTKCATDKDCGGCAVCIAGECKGLGEVECLADKDCADGEYCMVYEGMPCKNRCASKKCWVVDCAGNCDPVTNPCANGQQCVEPIKGCCGVCQ